MAANWRTVETMRAIVGKVSTGHFTTADLSFDETDWPRDPHANPQVAYLKTSDGTWLTVTVEHSEGDPR